MKCESCGGDLYHYAGCGVGEHGVIIRDRPPTDADKCKMCLTGQVGDDGQCQKCGHANGSKPTPVSTDAGDSPAERIAAEVRRIFQGNTPLSLMSAWDEERIQKLINFFESETPRIRTKAVREFVEKVEAVLEQNADPNSDPNDDGCISYEWATEDAIQVMQQVLAEMEGKCTNE